MVYSQQSLQLTNSMKQQLTIHHKQSLAIQFKPTEAKKKKKINK